MKAVVGAILVVLAVVALLAVDYILYQQQLAQNQQLQHQLQLSSARVDDLQAGLEQMDRQVRQMENASLGGIIDDANAALIEGWSAMVDAVERQLEQAKKNIEKEREDAGQAEPASDQGPD